MANNGDLLWFIWWSLAAICATIFGIYRAKNRWRSSCCYHCHAHEEDD